MSTPDGAGPSDGWAAPAGWGGPADPAPGPSGQAAYGQPTPPPQAYGQAPVYGGGPYGGWAPRPSESKPGVVPLRPLGLGEVLDGAVGVLRRYPRPALGIAAIVAVVSVLIQTVITATALRPFLQLDSQSLQTGGTAAIEGAIGGALAGGAVAIMLAVLTSAVLTGALTLVVGKAVLGEPMSLSQTWTSVRPVLLKLIGVSLLVLAIVGGVLLAGTVVGALLIALGAAGAVLGVLVFLATAAACVYVYVRLALAPCALVLERSGVRASLTRSGVLVKGDWWRVFGILLLVLVIGSFVSLTLQLPFEALGAGSLGGIVDAERDVLTARSLALSAVGSIVTATLITPFTAGARALLYVDRRMRAEGLDVALAAAASARS